MRAHDFGFAAVAVLAACTAFAHGGEDHGAPAARTAQATERRVAESQTETFEAVVKYEAAPAGDPLPIDLFLTDYATNAPVEGATIRVSIPDLKLEVDATPSSTAPGLYQLVATPGRSGTHSAIASITHRGTSDLLLFDGLVFGTDSAPPTAGGRKHFMLIGLGIVATLMSAFVLGRYSRSSRAAAVVIAFALLGVGQASAHGGEDHGAGPRSAGPASIAVVTKEAQLAFGIRTVVATEVMLPSVRTWRGVVLARPNGKAEVIAPQAGRVAADSERLPQVGDRVRQGQALLSVEGFLSPQEQVAAQGDLAEAEARLVAAEGELRVTERQWQRLAALPEIVSQRERDEAEARLATAGAAADAARRARDVLASSVGGGRSSAARYVLTAPIDGVITRASATIGEAVEAGRVFFSIVDTRHLWVRVNVPETDASVLSLAAGAKASIVPTSSTAEPVDAAFVSAARTIDPTTRTIAAFFETADSRDRLVEGQIVEALVETGGTSEGMIIPASAIVDIAGRLIAFVHVHAEEFAPREVVLGLASAGNVEVRSGLREGDRVVTTGAAQVRAALLSGT